MWIYKPKQALLFKLRKPERITEVIPTAKRVRVKNDVMIAVPHRPDEVKVLRNLGFEVPSPMPMYYEWSGTPFEAQKVTADFLSMNSRAFCLNSLGTGKTRAGLFAYDYLRSIKRAKRMLVTAPLSTLERTWGDEIFRHFPHLSFVVLHGTRERRLSLLKEKHDIYIINHDGLEIIGADLAGRNDIDVILVDELAVYRNASTGRWKMLNKVCNAQVPRTVWGFTGTPIPNEPTDAWAQARLVHPASPAVPKYFSRFRDSVMRQVSQFKWVPRDNALDIVKEVLSPAVRFSLEECADLPPLVYETREVAMTPEQAKAYKEMLAKLHFEYEQGQVTAVNEAVKAGKLLQIACGVAYSSSGEDIVIPAKPRMDALLELVEASEGKVIVFVPLTGALNRVADFLSEHYDTATIHGGTAKRERDEIFQTFQKETAINVIVAQPGCMSHGLTLTAATTIIWFGPVYSNEIYTQANGRIRRPGQTRSTIIAHITSTEVERRIYEKLRGRGRTQGFLLNMLKETSLVTNA